MPGSRRFAVGVLLLGVLLAGPAVWAQEKAGAPAPEAAPAKDALGRDTPRGTVLGFMNAARATRDEVAPQYLNTRLRDGAAIALAHQLFVVLDSRLPPRLSELSDRPEGSLPNPLKPDQDIVGTITTADGPLDIVLERVERGTARVWLFSGRTLELIPDVYDDIDLVTIDRFVPGFLTKPRIAGIRLFDWLVLVLIVPLCYQLTGVVGRAIRPALVAWRRRRGRAGVVPANLVPASVRLLLLAILIRWLVGVVELPLFERVFWSGVAAFLTIGAAVWALLLLNGVVERYVQRRLLGSGYAEIAAMLRLLRRAADTTAIAGGVLVALHHFGIDPTAALAGLGIGGIAVALAAQKTLENVIGGLSIIFDKAVRVDDFLKLGDTVGRVEYIGLRSTRIRTLDRTVLSVPNGQIANANIETLSARDKFMFRHTIGLSYETTAGQLRSVVTGINALLAAHPQVDHREQIRVRFVRFNAFSLDVDLFAYVEASDWEAFLEAQQDLLLEIMELVARAGAIIALPSQTLHMANSREDAPAAAGGVAAARPVRLEARHQAESA